MSKVIKSSQAARSTFAAYRDDVVDLEWTAPAGEGEQPGLVAPDPVAQAEAEAERRLQELFADGLQQGIEAGKAEFSRAAGEAVAALQNAAEIIRQAREDYLAALEPQVLELVGAITKRILQREARLDPEVTLTTVRAALRNLTERERLTVYLNPDDLQALQAQGFDPLAGMEGLEHVELAVDPSVGPGGCTVASDSVHADARLEHQLEMILDALAE